MSDLATLQALLAQAQVNGPQPNAPTGGGNYPAAGPAPDVQSPQPSGNLIPPQLAQQMDQAQRQQAGLQAPNLRDQAMPNIARFISQMIRPTASVQPGESAGQIRPPSRLDAFENFLGTFMEAFAQGMQHSGTGPGANMRGFGAAVLAPQQQAIQQFGLNQQAAAAQQQQAQAQAQLAETQARTAAIPEAIQEKLSQAQLASQTKLQTTGLNVAGREEVQKLKNVGVGQINQSNWANKMAQFKSTMDYKVWKEKLDTQTRLQVAREVTNRVNQNADKAPAAIMQSAVFANGGLTMLSDARAAMDRLKAKGVLGTLPANKVEDWIFGKGLVDPNLPPDVRNDIGKLRSAAGYTSSATMRSHTGRTSREVYADFKDRLGVGQDWNALDGAMDETQNLLTHYRDAASDASIAAMRRGGGGTPPATPAGGGGGNYSPGNPFAPKQ